MKQLKFQLKIVSGEFLVLVLRLVTAPAVFAMCPICTLAVGAGLGLSRYLGVNDMVSGIWVGAFLLSSSLWFTNWLEQKYKLRSKVKYLDVIIFVAMSSLVLLPLTWTNIIGHPFNKIWGIDKLIFGSVIGALVFLLAVFTDKKIRKIKEKQLFNFQKVIIPISFLTIASLLMYFFGGYLK